MDPYRFGYSPIVERPKLSWPKGARVAVWVCPNIEHYEYVPAEVRVRNPWPRMPHPDVLGYGGRDYGNRVGLWRMFEVLDKHSHPLHRLALDVGDRDVSRDPRGDGSAALGVHEPRLLQHALSLGLLRPRRSARSSSTARRRTCA